MRIIDRNRMVASPGSSRSGGRSHRLTVDYSIDERRPAGSTSLGKKKRHVQPRLGREASRPRLGEARALAVSVMDLAAIVKRDKVIRAFERAQAAHEGARARPG
jgi:hypothetical protein